MSSRALCVLSVLASSLIPVAPGCVPAAGEQLEEAAQANGISDSEADILTMRLQSAPALDIPLAQRIDAVLEKARDSVVGTSAYGCHAFAEWNLHTVNVVVTGAIASAWATGTPVTGVAALDGLLASYGTLSVDKPPPGAVTPMVPSASAFSLRFRVPIRANALVADLSQIPGVISASLIFNTKGPSDTDVLLEPAPGGWRVRFVEALNSCGPSTLCPALMATEVFVGNDGSVMVKGRGPLQLSPPLTM